jgi:hypothetical protein
MTTAIETTIAAKTEDEISDALRQKKVQFTVIALRRDGKRHCIRIAVSHRAMVALGRPHG